MEISKKEAIVSLFVYVMLFLILMSCVIVLKASSISVLLSIFASFFIIIGSSLVLGMIIESKEVEEK